MLGLTYTSIKTSILFCLSDNPTPDSNPQARRVNAVVPPQPPLSQPAITSKKQQKGKQPSVAEIERAIGAGIYRDRDVSRETEQDKTFFDSILSNSIGKTEGDVEKKLRETGEWIIDQTEGPSRSSGKNILKALFIWILPVWMLSFLVASGVIKLPFLEPFLDDLIM